VKKLQLILFLLLQLGAVNLLKAQVDPHFSQYYANPLWLNPALTGVIDGDIRANANFRNQWATISNPYSTAALSVDFRSTEKVSLGVNILNQAAGTAGYNYFTAYGSFGYGITISKDGFQKLHFGLQAGIINRSFDPSKLQEDNQYNPVLGFDPGIATNEVFSTTNSIVFDASAGIFYYDSDPQKTSNFFAGVSAAHLTDTKDPFAADGIKSTLPVRITVHGGVHINATEQIAITPHFIYIRQQQNQMRAVGAYSEFKFPDEKGLILGGMYRVDDAAIAEVGYHHQSTIIGMSYDFNTSALRTATNGQGGLELSIIYVFKNRFQSTSHIPGM
jgi:type IX secretion system PorP/SprF family membrane protein